MLALPWSVGSPELQSVTTDNRGNGRAQAGHHGDGQFPAEHHNRAGKVTLKPGLKSCKDETAFKGHCLR